MILWTFHAVLVLLSAVATTALAELSRLKVSDNQRFLVCEDGKPFFWLGDTAWELFHRLNREQVDRYLEDRADKGYTVIQAVALAELNGHSDPNPYGHLPLIDQDPARPAVQDGPDNDYWDHVDYVVDKANSLGMYIGFLPTWGRYWHDEVQDGKPLFTVQNAEIYGQWLGQRYRDKHLIWILGGDRTIRNEQDKDLMRAMARGIRKGDGGRHLMTFHPRGGQGSAEYFHDEPWLDFNMRQNGHNVNFEHGYHNTRIDYDRTPIKPVLDGEPIYEDHPVRFRPVEEGHSIASDVRRPLYWNLFTGAFGHTYGHHSVWQMWQPGRSPVNNPLTPWYEAIDQHGAGQMQYGRWLIESRPFLTRVPDDSILVTHRSDHTQLDAQRDGIVSTKLTHVATSPNGEPAIASPGGGAPNVPVVPTSVPGAGRYRFVATRDIQGTYAMVYAPVGRSFRVRMDAITGAKVRAWWYDPRNGQSTEIGTFEDKGERDFTPPDPGEMADWVLVLDDATKNYPAPGTRK
jgi:hypothetical protein